MNTKIEDIVITESSNRGYIGQNRGIIYLNNRALRSDHHDYIFSIQTYDRVVVSAILDENQIVELIKSLELLLADKEDTRKNPPQF